MTHQQQIERALDAAVILLEGGTDEDLDTFLQQSEQPKSSVDGDAEVPGVDGPPGMETDDGAVKKNGTATTNLHKNVAIFLRNVPVDIPRAELEKVCSFPAV